MKGIYCIYLSRFFSFAMNLPSKKKIIANYKSIQSWCLNKIKLVHVKKRRVNHIIF